jgi:rhamnulokinase
MIQLELGRHFTVPLPHMPNHFLAFDLGAESGRALLGAIDGGKLTLDEQHRFANPHGRINGRLCWNLLGQWEHLKEGLRKTAATGKTLQGIGVDTWGVDFGLLNKDGDILGNPLHYRDSHTDGVMDQVFARIGRDRVFQQTGTQFMQFNTLFQLQAMKNTSPQLLEMADTLLFMPDLFNYLFTGQRAAEFSIASTSQMYDMGQKAWARPLLDELGLPANILPTVVPSGTIIGNLRDDVAKECSCPPIPVIAPAGHDTASAVAAVPAAAGDRSWCYISSGTWSLMGVELPRPIINDKSLKYSYTNEGGVGGSIRFLKNIMGMWLVQECRRHWIKAGSEHSYAELTQMAERSQSTALIDPDHQPFLAPGDMVPKIDEFCRKTHQRAPGTRGEYVRACLESLALTYRKTLERLEDILGRRLETIHIVGGGTQNGLLNQMTADACNRRVVTGPVEATAIGNILVQAMAVGVVKSLDDARAIVRNSFDVQTYEPRDTKKWDAAYDRFREIVT